MPISKRKAVQLLEKCAKQFRDYEQLHLSKVKPDPANSDEYGVNVLARQKAKVNADLAKELEDFLNAM